MYATLSRSLLPRLAALCAAFVVAAAAGTNAQTTAANEPIRVIPQPRELTRNAAADFQLTRDARLVLADVRSADDRFAAQDFADDMRATSI